MELLHLDANLNFKQHSRRNHYINEEISAEFIHFNAIADIEVERCLTIQEQDLDTPPFTDARDTIIISNLRCVSKDDDITVIPFSIAQMDYIEELIINEIKNKL